MDRLDGAQEESRVVTSAVNTRERERERERERARERERESKKEHRMTNWEGGHDRMTRQDDNHEHDSTRRHDDDTIRVTR
jgi:hypothetical protein